MWNRCVVLALWMLSVAGDPWSAALAENPPADDAVLNVWTLEGSELHITRELWSQAARTRLKAVDHSGRLAEFEGVSATELLKRAAAPLGGQLRGKALAIYVVAEGSDGYRAVYALPEFDAGFTDDVILIADRRDGKALDAKEGPLRMVVPGDKREARWVRNLVSLRLLRAP